MKMKKFISVSYTHLDVYKRQALWSSAINTGSTAPTIACSNALREARMKVSSTFSKVAGSRDRVPGRPPQRAEFPYAY